MYLDRAANDAMGEWIVLNSLCASVPLCVVIKLRDRRIVISVPLCLCVS